MRKNVQVIAVIALLVGILLVGLVITPIVPVGNNEDSFIIKEQIGTLKLTEKLEGKEALEEINQLHGKLIEIEAGYILHYKNESDMAIVWISKSKIKEDAVLLYNKMNDLMGQSEMYQKHSQFDVDGKTVQYVYGMNMDNYYYYVDDRVVWIAITSDEGKQFIKEAVNSF